MMANTFQVLISLAYVAYDGLVSGMLVADEWCGFAKDRKTLRVSAPVGMQRSSYALSKPLSYGIPMKIIFLASHWLISQSTFIVRINKFNYDGQQGRGWTVSGYSLVPSLLGKKHSTDTNHSLLTRVSKSYQPLFPTFHISNRSRQSSHIPSWLCNAICIYLQRGHQCCMSSSWSRQGGSFATGAMGRCRERWSEYAILFLYYLSGRCGAFHRVFLLGNFFVQGRPNADWFTRSDL